MKQKDLAGLSNLSGLLLAETSDFFEKSDVYEGYLGEFNLDVDYLPVARGQNKRITDG